ncbi:hypothetical protein D1007_38395 [Hordeum vulgare]|nr:hypothetical protein D1007_38395 [Hordeum vulgare]
MGARAQSSAVGHLAPSLARSELELPGSVDLNPNPPRPGLLRPRLAPPQPSPLPLASSSSITESIRRPGGTCFCEEENAGEELASDAHAPAGREGAARDCDGELRAMNTEAAAKLNMPRASEDDEEDEDKYVSVDNYVQIGGWEQGRKRKATVSVTPNGVQPIGIEIQNKTNHGECLRAENQMLRLQIVSKTEELEAKQIRRLELELHLKTEENKSLKKQNEELRSENEYYRKTVSSTRNSVRTRVPVD